MASSQQRRRQRLLKSPSSSNALRLFAASPTLTQISSETLYVDGAYSLPDVAERLASKPLNRPDPRWFKPDVGRQWAFTRQPPPPSGWSSPQAPADPAGTLEEVLKITFDDEKPINSLSLEVGNVACNFRVQVLDRGSGHYLPLTDVDGNAVGGRVPGLRRPVNAPNGKPVGQVSWVPFSFRFPIVTTKEIEIRLDRRVSLADAPLTANSTVPAPYSVSVRKVRPALDVSSRDEAPPSGSEFGVRTALGFLERVGFVDYDPLRATDDDGSTYWLSAPCPYADSVVPFYLDVRQDDGSASRVDRLAFAPLAPGPSMNVYWSTDRALNGEFWAGRGLAEGILGGTAAIVPGEGVSSASDGEFAQLGVRAAEMEISPDRPWYVGAQYRPNYASDVGGTTRRWVFDLAKGPNRSLGVCYDPFDSRFVLVLWNGSTQIDILTFSPPAPFSAGDPMTVVVGWDPSLNDYIMAVSFPGIWSGFTGTPGPYFTDDEVILDTVWAASSSVRGDTPRSGQGVVGSVWFKQETPNFEVTRAFAVRPDLFVDGSGARDRLNGAHDALLLWPLTASTEARVGPGEGYHDARVWNPVTGDFSLKPGVLTIPPVTARWLKLEFSDLVPKPYAVPSGTKLLHRAFPPWVDKWFEAVESQAQPSSSRVPRATPLSPFQTAFGPPTLLGGIRGDAGQQDVRRRIEVSGTELSITSANSSAWSRARDSDQDKSGVPPSGRSAPRARRRFFQTGIHQYSTQAVPVTRQEAYFVGLREVKAIRLVYPEG